MLQRYFMLLAMVFLTFPLCSTAQVITTIDAAEYYFDTDPGLGNGSPISPPFTGDSVHWASTVTVPSNLDGGPHILYLRTHAVDSSLKGYWSLAAEKQFYIRGQQAVAEYFFDTDPGIGNGTPLSFTNPNDSVNQNFSVIIPTTLNSGPHQLYVRSRDEKGIWSHASEKSFYITPKIIAAEYFYDTDPGKGLGTALSINSSNDSLNQNFSIVVPATLAGGDHQLYIRTQEDNKVWSLCAERSFYLLPTIVEAEYFFDTDPGYGNGTPLVITSPSDSINQTFTVSSPCLLSGQHYLYVRTKDTRGIWSHTDTSVVSVSNSGFTLAAIVPGPGPNGTPIKLKADGGKLPYRYSMNSSAPTLDSIFLAANNTAVTLTVVDDCSNTVSNNLTTPAAPLSIAVASTGSSTVDFQGYREPVYMMDAVGDVIGTLNDNGVPLGPITLSYLKNSSALRQFNNGTYLLDRNWLVADTTTGNSLKDIRLYALNAEFNSLKSQDPSLNVYTDLYLTKYDGSNQDLDPANNVYNNNSALFAANTHGTFGAGFYLGASVTDFSEFYLSKNYLTPLPLTDVTLKATVQKDGIQLNWNVKNEDKISSYTLLKEKGNTWQPLQTMLENAEKKGRYRYTDEAPLNGKNLYKISINSKDGGKYETQVAIAWYGEGRHITLYPNPAKSIVNIDGWKGNGQFNMIDASGRIVVQQSLADGNNVIGLGNLATGVYVIRMITEEGTVMYQQLTVVP